MWLQSNTNEAGFQLSTEVAQHVVSDQQVKLWLTNGQHG